VVPDWSATPLGISLVVGAALTTRAVMTERRELVDDDWDAVRIAVPSFNETWNTIVSDSRYDPTLAYVSIHDFAEFVVGHVVRQRPEEFRELGDTLEAEFTKAAIHDDESYEGLLRIGVLEGLINAADDVGMPLTWLVPLLRGPRVRDQWHEVRRGRRSSDQICQLDLRLVSGRLRPGDLLRHRISKDFWDDYTIAAVRQRSTEITSEFEIDVESENQEHLEMWDYYLLDDDLIFWQIAINPQRELE
jgi:hypothetical protein